MAGHDDDELEYCFDEETDDERVKRPKYSLLCPKYMELWKEQTKGTELEGRVIPPKVAVHACSASRPNGEWVVRVENVFELYALSTIRDECKKKGMKDAFDAETKRNLDEIKQVLLKQDASLTIQQAMETTYGDLRQQQFNALFETHDKELAQDDDFKKEFASNFIRNCI